MRVYLRRNNLVLSRREIKYAVQFMSSLIMSKQLLKHLIVYIEFVESLNDDGDCLWLDDNHCPRKFQIRVSPSLTRKKNLLIVLAHELVHIKQYALNEMRDMIRCPVDSRVKWKKDFINDKKVHYYDLPWEIEARGREYGMYVRYLEHLRTEKVVL